MTPKGQFSLHDVRGLTLTVSVNKAGYYPSKNDNDSFKYGSLGGGKFTPDPSNPVIFHLQKKGLGESLIKAEFPPGIGQIAQLHHDGIPIGIDLLNSKKVMAGAGQLNLEFRRDTSESNAKTFDWRFQISVPGGGLVKTDEEFAFQAPQAGYQPSFIVDMSATNANWNEDITDKFYFQLPDGKFGRMELYFSGYNGVFTIHSLINPTGSYNLEPSQ